MSTTESRYALWRSKSNTSVTDQFPHNSIGLKTFNNVIETLLCIAHRHKFVEQVDSGDIWQVDLEKNTTYPYFHCVPSEVQAQSNQMIFNFQLIIMDLVEPALNNEQQVMSDTLQIMIDIISAFRNGDLVRPNEDERDIYYTEGDFTLNPFTERFDASVTGWVLDLPVYIDYPFTTCVDIFNDGDCIQ